MTIPFQSHSTLIIFFLVYSFLTFHVAGIQIISKSKLEKCEKNSNSDDLNCTTKIVVSMAVPSGSVNHVYFVTFISKLINLATKLLLHLLYNNDDCIEWRRGVDCCRIGGGGRKFNHKNADIADSTGYNGQQNCCLRSV